LVPPPWPAVEKEKDTIWLSVTTVRAPIPAVPALGNFEIKYEALPPVTGGFPVGVALSCWGPTA
jgi:hypothetical protein